MDEKAKIVEGYAYAKRIFLQNSDTLPWRECLALKSTAKLLSYVDMATRNLVFTLTAELPGIFAERIEVHEKWPADWWQAFKERWFPRWLKRWFPVQWKRLDIEKDVYAAVCPHVDLSNQDQHIRWMYHESQKVQDGDA